MTAALHVLPSSGPLSTGGNSNRAFSAVPRVAPSHGGCCMAPHGAARPHCPACLTRSCRCHCRGHPEHRARNGEVGGWGGVAVNRARSGSVHFRMEPTRQPVFAYSPLFAHSLRASRYSLIAHSSLIFTHSSLFARSPLFAHSLRASPYSLIAHNKFAHSPLFTRSLRACPY